MSRFGKEKELMLNTIWFLVLMRSRVDRIFLNIFLKKKRLILLVFISLKYIKKMLGKML